MCIIAKGYKKDLRRTEVERCMETNPSGFFIAVLKQNPKDDVFVRTLERNPILKAYDAADADDMIVTHSRIPSRGGMEPNLQDVHGWCEDGVRFCHNMTFTCLDEVQRRDKCEHMTDSEYFFRRIFMPLFRSEGRTFTPLVDRIVRAVAGANNRLLFILPDNAVVTYGPFVEDHNVMFSNKSYLPAPTGAPAALCSARTTQPCLPFNFRELGAAGPDPDLVDAIRERCAPDALRLVVSSPAVYGARFAMAERWRLDLTSDRQWLNVLERSMEDALPELFSQKMLRNACEIVRNAAVASDDDIAAAAADFAGSACDFHDKLGEPEQILARIMARLRVAASSYGIFVDPYANSLSGLVHAFLPGPARKRRLPTKLTPARAFTTAGVKPEGLADRVNKMLRLARKLKSQQAKMAKGVVK